MSSWTQADLVAIEKAIGSGVSKVKYQDKEVTYRTTEEMLKARDLIRKALGVTRKSLFTYAEFDNDLG